MPRSVIDSLIFRDIFGSPAMREIWADEFRTQKYLDWQVRLARVEAMWRSSMAISKTDHTCLYHILDQCGAQFQVLGQDNPSYVERAIARLYTGVSHDHRRLRQKDFQGT